MVDCTKERFCNDSDSDMDSIRKLVLYSFVFLWGGGCVCAAQEMFSTKREFGPVRFSQEQLLELVDRLRVFAKQQGSPPAESDDASQTLSLSDGQTTLRISEEISVETVDAAPPVATSVYYQYLNRTGVISSINIRLWDTSRTVEISGRSRDQVEAAASVASTIISQAETIVGGSTQRSWGGIFLNSCRLDPFRWQRLDPLFGTAANKADSYSFNTANRANFYSFNMAALGRVAPRNSSLSR